MTSINPDAQPTRLGVEVVEHMCQRMQLGLDTFRTAVIDGNAPMAQMAAGDMLYGAHILVEVARDCLTVAVAAALSEKYGEDHEAMEVAAQDPEVIYKLLGITPGEAADRWEALCNTSGVAESDLPDFGGNDGQ